MIIANFTDFDVDRIVAAFVMVRYDMRNRITLHPKKLQLTQNRKRFRICQGLPDDLSFLNFSFFILCQNSKKMFFRFFEKSDIIEGVTNSFEKVFTGDDLPFLGVFQALSDQPQWTERGQRIAEHQSMQ